MTHYLNIIEHFISSLAGCIILIAVGFVFGWATCTIQKWRRLDNMPGIDDVQNAIFDSREWWDK